MILKILFLLTLFVDTYLLLSLLYQTNVFSKMTSFIEQKNQKYYQEFLKKYQKNQKVKLHLKKSWPQQVNNRIHKLGLKPYALFNPASLIGMAFLSFFAGYCLLHLILGSKGLAFVASVPFFSIPFIFLEFIEDMRDQKIEKILLNFLLQLKNYTKINNDILYAMREIKTTEPLQGYLNSFLIEINSGVPFENAIFHLSEEIHNDTLQNFFSNLTHCYLYGGDFSLLISKSYEMIRTLQKEKEKRLAETKSARIVLWILILLNLLVFFTNIQNHVENYHIMQRTVIGNVILYWNFISMWLLMILSSKVKKLDY